MTSTRTISTRTTTTTEPSPVTVTALGPSSEADRPREGGRRTGLGPPGRARSGRGLAVVDWTGRKPGERRDPGRAARSHRDGRLQPPAGAQRLQPRDVERSARGGGGAGPRPGVRAIVFRGAGEEAFASGADISEFRENRKDRASAEAYNARTAAAAHAMETCPKPTVAMIYGYCMGGAVATAMACDLRFSADTGKFGIPAGRLGIIYGLHAVKRLVSLVGPATAKDILFSARLLDAQEALRVGFVQRVVPAAELDGLHLRLPRPRRRQRAAHRSGREGDRRGHRRGRGRREAGRHRAASSCGPSRARTTRKARPRSWRSGGPGSSAGSPARGRGARSPRRALPRCRRSGVSGAWRRSFAGVPAFPVRATHRPSAGRPS